MSITNIIRLRIWSLNWSTLFSQFARFYLVSSINHHDRLFLLTDSLLSPNLTVSPDSLGFHLSWTWKPLSPDSLRSPFHLIILFHIIIRCHLVRKHSSENLVAKCLISFLPSSSEAQNLYHSARGLFPSSHPGCILNAQYPSHWNKYNIVIKDRLIALVFNHLGPKDGWKWKWLNDPHLSFGPVNSLYLILAQFKHEQYSNAHFPLGKTQR